MILSAGCSGQENQQGPEGKTAVYPHPDFTITLEELSEITADLPESIQQDILDRPQYFLQLILQVLSLPEDTLLLVDKGHSLPSDYIPDDLVPLSSYTLSLNRNDLSLRARIMPDVLAMNEAARQDGISLVFSSCYRSYEYQQGLYERNVRELGKEQADRESAKPGTSQHQLGTTVDFGSITDAFGSTPAGKWLYKHAWEYGFSLSYPEGYEDITGYRHEIWHYRHITRLGTRIEQEFFQGIQQYFLEFLNSRVGFLHSKIIAG